MIIVLFPEFVKSKSQKKPVLPYKKQKPFFTFSSKLHNPDGIMKLSSKMRISH